MEAWFQNSEAVWGLPVLHPTPIEERTLRAAFVTRAGVRVDAWESAESWMKGARQAGVAFVGARALVRAGVRDAVHALREERYPRAARPPTQLLCACCDPSVAERNREQAAALGIPLVVLPKEQATLRYRVVAACITDVAAYINELLGRVPHVPPSVRAVLRRGLLQQIAGPVRGLGPEQPPDLRIDSIVRGTRSSRTTVSLDARRAGVAIPPLFDAYLGMQIVLVRSIERPAQHKLAERAGYRSRSGMRRRVERGLGELPGRWRELPPRMGIGICLQRWAAALTPVPQK